MSDASSIVSSSSTLIGDVSSIVSKNGRPVRPVRPHRRAASTLGLGPCGGGSVASDNPFIIPTSPKVEISPPTASSSPSAFLMRSNSIPSIPSFKPKEIRLPRPEGCRLINVLELQREMEMDEDESLVILDVRPFVDYSRASIRGSVHVCLPSTLLRRKTFTLDRLIENLPEEERVTVRSKVLDCPDSSKMRVVIFDNNSQTSDNAVSIGCHGMACKFLHYVGWCNSTCPQVSILECGFNKFKEIVPELVVQPCTVADNTRPPLLNFSKSTSYISVSPQPPLDSPLSSCSPVAKLFKFQLPANTGCPPPFKMPQHEEINNLESYLSAVNLGEKHFGTAKFPIGSPNELKSAFPTPTEFTFPPVKTSPTSVDLTSPCRTSLNRNDNKLNFQKRCSMLSESYASDRVDCVVPQWFRDIVLVSKLDIVSQFQKVDLLEKKRLSYCLSNTKPEPASLNYQNNKQHEDSPKTPGTELTKCCVTEWLDSYDSDEDDRNICVSSGVELGVKNRYKDIFPYEHTRVVLKKSHTSNYFGQPNDIWDTYINANYLVNPFIKLETPNMERCRNVRYIATQAPLTSTINDFYTCVLNNNVPLILTLTDEYENGVEKCHKFWAEGNYDGIVVKLLEEYCLPSSEIADVKDGEIYVRRIQLTYDDQHHFETLQLQIKNWPDLGVLVQPRQILEVICVKNLILEQLFQNKVYPEDYLPNVLVHCSAGCGRTGTLCTLDSVLANLPKLNYLRHEWVEIQTARNVSEYNSRDKPFDNEIFDPVIITINKFRKQRISMVQNVNQYVFIYECLLSYFTLNLNNDNILETDSWRALEKRIRHLEVLQHFIENKITESL